MYPDSANRYQLCTKICIGNTNLGFQYRFFLSKYTYIYIFSIVLE